MFSGDLVWCWALLEGLLGMMFYDLANFRSFFFACFMALYWLKVGDFSWPYLGLVGGPFKKESPRIGPQCAYGDDLHPGSVVAGCFYWIYGPVLTKVELFYIILMIEKSQSKEHLKVPGSLIVLVILRLRLKSPWNDPVLVEVCTLSGGATGCL